MRYRVTLANVPIDRTDGRLVQTFHNDVDDARDCAKKLARKFNMLKFPKAAVRLYESHEELLETWEGVGDADNPFPERTQAKANAEAKPPTTDIPMVVALAMLVIAFAVPAFCAPAAVTNSTHADVQHADIFSDSSTLSAFYQILLIALLSAILTSSRVAMKAGRVLIAHARGLSEARRTYREWFEKKWEETTMEQEAVAPVAPVAPVTPVTPVTPMPLHAVHGIETTNILPPTPNDQRPVRVSGFNPQRRDYKSASVSTNAS